MDNWESSKLKQANLAQSEIMSVQPKMPKLNLIEEDSLTKEGTRVKETLNQLEKRKVQLQSEMERVYGEKLLLLERKEKEKLKLSGIGTRA